MFMAGSLAAALATNMLTLILARGLQGLGAGGLLPLAQTIVGDVVLPKERGRYQTYLSVMWMTAAIAGPMLGGFLSEYSHWSVIFWINIPLGLLALYMSNEVLKGLPSVARPHKLDILGSLLMMAAAVSLLLALTSGGVRFGPRRRSSALVGSAVFWLLFVARLRTAPEPFPPPLNILSNQVVRTGILLSSFNMSCIIGLTHLHPDVFRAGAGSVLEPFGLALIPLMVVSNIGAAVAGRGLGYFHHYKRVPMGGCMACPGADLADDRPAAVADVGIDPSRRRRARHRHGLPGGDGGGAKRRAAPSAWIATGTMNFFRALLSAVIVAGLGAIILGGINLKGGSPVAAVLHGASGGSAELALVFRWVFAACG